MLSQGDGRGLWVCDMCARCDGCGVVAPCELTGHWAKDDDAELQLGWASDATRRLLCGACSVQPCLRKGRLRKGASTGRWMRGRPQA